MQLVPVSQVVRNQTTIEYEDPKVIQEKLRELEAEKRNLVVQLGQATACQSQLSSILTQFNHVMGTRFSVLTRLLRQVNAILDVESAKDIDSDRYDEIQEVLCQDQDYLDNLNRVREHNRNLSEATTKKKRKKSSGSRRIFNKIALKCHPDRTSVTWKHAIFLQAKEALNHDDYQLLEKLFKIVSLGKPPVIYELEGEIETLMVRLNHFQAHAQLILSSEDFKQAHRYFTRNVEFDSGSITATEIEHWYKLKTEASILAKARHLNLLKGHTVIPADSIEDLRKYFETNK